MGKKHNKFKKHGKSISSSSNTPNSPITPIASTPDSELLTPISEPAKPEKIDEMELLNEKYEFVHHDVRKLGIVLGSLVVLFVATYFLNAHTTILTNLGDWIYKIGHFSI